MDIKIYRYITKLIVCLIAFNLVFFLNKTYSRADNIILVIDPGHGGDNLGGHTDEYIEQELTLKVASYMKERLEEYEGIEVYLTHDTIGDKDLSREERAEIAANLNADFVCSLHFNMSENHTLYGSEVWTSAFDDYYVKGQEFGRILTEDFHNELGFFDRGVKTRLGKTGDDYYGIILKCKNKGIPAVIIEHCHLDESRDNVFLKENDNPYKAFGYTDADAIAKFYGLKSSSLGIDYSSYNYEKIDRPTEAMGPDRTEPEYCNISLVDYDTIEGRARVSVEAFDPDDRMQYYQYSTDNGNSYSILYPWNSDPDANYAVSDNSIEISLPLEIGRETDLMVKAYNRYELTAESNSIRLPAAEEVNTSEAYEEDNSVEEIVLPVEDESTEPVKAISVKKILDIREAPDTFILYMAGGVIILTLLFSAFLVLFLINAAKKRKRRNKRRKFDRRY